MPPTQNKNVFTEEDSNILLDKGLVFFLQHKSANAVKQGSGETVLEHLLELQSKLDSSYDIQPVIIQLLTVKELDKPNLELQGRLWRMNLKEELFTQLSTEQQHNYIEKLDLFFNYQDYLLEYGATPMPPRILTSIESPESFKYRITEPDTWIERFIQNNQIYFFQAVIQHSDFQTVNQLQKTTAINKLTGSAASNWWHRAAAANTNKHSAHSVILDSLFQIFPEGLTQKFNGLTPKEFALYLQEVKTTFNSNFNPNYICHDFDKFIDQLSVYEQKLQLEKDMPTSTLEAKEALGSYKI